MSKSIVEITLKQKQVHQLLKLEALFHSHYLTEELLNQMVSLYVKFVQNVPSNQHPLRVFFMEKIKFVLSRTEVIKILQKDQHQNIQNLRNTIRQMQNNVQFQQIEMKKLTEETKAEIRQNHKINLKKQRGVNEDSSLKEKERNMKIEMQIKIMEEMQNNMIEFRKDYTNKQKIIEKKNAKINNMVNMQDQNLNQRLANRKKKIRKNSANLNTKEVIVVQSAQPIPKEELIAVQKQLNQTYERFTRLTMSKQNSLNSKEKQNKGRVKINTHDQLQQEQLNIQFKKPEVMKEEGKLNFSKKKNQPQKNDVEITQPQNQTKRGTETTTIEYKAFDQTNKGRVTKNFKLYEQIEQQEVF